MGKTFIETKCEELEQAKSDLAKERAYTKELEYIIEENQRNFMSMKLRLAAVEDNVLEFKFKHVVDIHRAGMMRDEDMIEMAHRNASRALADSIMLKAICEKETNNWGQPVFTFTIRIPKE